MQNELNSTLSKYLVGRMTYDFPAVADLIPHLQIKTHKGRVEKVDIVPKEQVKLSHECKEALVSTRFGYELKDELLGCLDQFEVVIGKAPFVHDSDEFLVEPPSGVLGYQNETLRSRIDQIRMAIQSELSAIKKRLQNDAKYLAINLRDYDKQNYQTEVLRSVEVGRCRLVISKLYRTFEPEDWYNPERMHQALHLVATGNGEFFTVTYEVFWDCKSVHHTSMEGYMTEFEKDPMSEFAKPIKRLAKEALFVARLKLQQAGGVLTPEQKQEVRLFAGIKLH
ncbi:hypothetical protein ACU8KO_002671 [Vibrio alginolyticus]